MFLSANTNQPRLPPAQRSPSGQRWGLRVLRKPAHRWEAEVAPGVRLQGAPGPRRQDAGPQKLVVNDDK